VPVGEVRGLTAALCVARLSETEVVALTRRCPHAGGDIANGWVDGNQVVCPWHNLPFDTASGRSPCSTLPALRRVACEIRGDRIVVDPKSVLNAEAAVEAAE
jgi:nitrite reductase/ring-hydroxylating ferredoxin subunit